MYGIHKHFHWTQSLGDSQSQTPPCRSQKMTHETLVLCGTHAFLNILWLLLLAVTLHFDALMVSHLVNRA